MTRDQKVIALRRILNSDDTIELERRYVGEDRKIVFETGRVHWAVFLSDNRVYLTRNGEEVFSTTYHDEVVTLFTHLQERADRLIKTRQQNMLDELLETI